MNIHEIEKLKKRLNSFILSHDKKMLITREEAAFLTTAIHSWYSEEPTDD